MLHFFTSAGEGPSKRHSRRLLTGHVSGTASAQIFETPTGREGWEDEENETEGIFSYSFVCMNNINIMEYYFIKPF